MEVNFNVTLSDGTSEEVPVSLEMYKEAEAAGLTVPQLVNSKYPTADNQPTAFEQMLVTSGMFMSEDRTFGHRSPTLNSVLEPGPQFSAITRPDGSRSNTPSGRLLFPAVLIEMVEHQLRTNDDSYVGAFNSMVSTVRSLSSPKYEQVVINHSASRAQRAQPISQLDRPNRILTFTTSDRSFTIPTYSIGMEVSKEAMKQATLDMVALAMREHTLEERAAVIDRDVAAMVNGDTDMGVTALSSVTAQSFDPAITAAGNITHRAWVKYLRQNWRTLNITDVLCDIDTYLAIEGRTGRPTKDAEPAVDERLNSTPRIMIPGIPSGVNFFITEDSLLGANTLVGLDRSKAIRRVVYAGAEYSGIEEYVMRKATAFRIDWAERYERNGYDEAFKMMTLTV